MIRLSESQLKNIVRKIIKEQEENPDQEEVQFVVRKLFHKVLASVSQQHAADALHFLANSKEVVIGPTASNKLYLSSYPDGKILRELVPGDEGSLPDEIIFAHDQPHGCGWGVWEVAVCSIDELLEE